MQAYQMRPKRAEGSKYMELSRKRSGVSESLLLFK